MSERRRVLELFEQNEAFYKDTVLRGIEENRKGDIAVTVTDGDGKKVEGASVRLEQKNHAFRFGANIFMLDELETEEKNDTYKKRFSELFNMATLPFYWDSLEPQQGKPRYAKDSVKVYRRPSPDLCIEFCEKHGIEPREHALAYAGFFPKWMVGMDNETVKRVLENRYREIAERYADKIPTIEVTNEMDWATTRTKFYDEPDFLEWCYRKAEQYFPNNVLCINEATNAAWADHCRTSGKYYAYIENTLLKGARIDAIGLQYHLFNRAEDEYEKTRTLLDPLSLWRHMDLYARLGRELQITEVTVPAYTDAPEDEAIQAEIIERLYTLWFAHPATTQIVYWNLVDGYAHLWDPDPEKIKASQGDMTIGENYYRGGLLRFDLSEKPAYTKIKELLQRVWHTDETLATDCGGKASARGFYGDYDVTVTKDGKAVTKTVSLRKGEENSFYITL